MVCVNIIPEKEIPELLTFIEENLAQKSKKEDRLIIDKTASSFGGKLETRDEFTRDKDRILHTKAFRRLQHKAQVHSYEKGDHYRTRLTHTLEVNQISRGLASNLHLNDKLAEAIALGHDIGHTPFGHAGEKILDEIMRGKEDFDGKLLKIDYGGFKHNFNSAKILDIVEKEYLDERGLNLTWQVLEGIIKHTRIIKKGKTWNWKRFVKTPEFLEEFLYNPQNMDENNYQLFSVTLE